MNNKKKLALWDDIWAINSYQVECATTNAMTNLIAARADLGDVHDGQFHERLYEVKHRLKSISDKCLELAKSVDKIIKEDD